MPRDNMFKFDDKNKDRKRAKDIRFQDFSFDELLGT